MFFNNYLYYFNWISLEKEGEKVDMKFKERYSWGGWQNCLYISNDTIDIVATTDIGPRIMRCGFFDERNLFLGLTEQMGKRGGETFRIYGGARLWHSPEDNPRSYMPDNKPIKHKWDGKTLNLLQPVEIATGMQKEMNITIAPSENKIEIVYRIYNKNLWPIRFSTWALTIMAQNGKVIIPQEPFKKSDISYTPSRPMVLWPYTEMNDPRFIWGKRYIQIKQDPKLKKATKIGLLNKRGWAAYYLDKYIFIKRYSFNKNAEYPDYMCNTEIYTNHNLFEFETLGPLKEIKPGTFSEHKENWYLFKDVVIESEESIDKNLLPLIKKTEIPK